MDSLYLLIPIALLFCAIGIKLLLWAIDSGQYDDLDKEAWKILADDEPVPPTAGPEQSESAKGGKTMTELGYASALGLGLAGAGHCLGMCGGIAAALSLGGSGSPTITLAYHAGRISSYTLLGGALGYAAGSIDIAAWTVGLRYLAGFMLVGMGLYIADWWRGMALLERAGARLWRPVQRLSSRWLPVRHWPQGFALGLCWGLMPCGLIYSSLAWAATAQHAPTSALMMFLFGLGTLPAMLATSLGAQGLQAFLKKRGLKLLIAVLLVVSGAWTLYITAAHSGHSSHGGATSSQPMEDHSHMHH